jgi:hypothetical protein
MHILCSKKFPLLSEPKPVVELSDSRLRALCRVVGMLGIFSPARWREWNISEIAGFWVGRPRKFPPQFWMFESNTAYSTEWLVVRSPDARRFYVREFGALDSTDSLLEALRSGGVREFSDPKMRP